MYLLYLHFGMCVHLCCCVSVCVCVVAHPYPGDYGEEREGNCRPGCIRPLVEWQLVSRGPRPLIGQEAETHKVQESPETCQKPEEEQHFVTTERERGNSQADRNTW